MSTDPLFMKVGSEYYWYHNDHLGMPQMMTTSSGAVVWKVKYSSFGKATVDPSSAVMNPLRMPGQYEDVETGLYYNGYRYYDAEIGSYLRIDPLRLSQLHILINGLFNGIWRTFPIGLNEKFKQLLIVYYFYQYGIANPLSQNVYSYAQDSPANLIDPHGLFVMGVGGSVSGAYYGGVDAFAVGAWSVPLDGSKPDSGVVYNAGLSFGPQFGAGAGPTVVFAPFANSVTDIRGVTMDFQLRFGFQLTISIPREGFKGLVFAFDFTPSPIAGFGVGASYTIVCAD